MLHRIVSRYAGVFAAASLGLGLAACEDNTSGTPLPPPPASTAVVVTAVAPTPDEGTVDTDVAEDLTFKVTNPNGSVAANVVVQFVVAGGGLIEQSQATSDGSGLVSPGTWHLGKKAGTQRLTATPPSGDAAFVDVAAAAGPFAELDAPAGLANSPQIANRPTAVAPVFVVADEFNNRAGADVEVTFVALEGSIEETDPVESSDNGDVSPGAWTLDGTIGPQRLVANYEVDGVPVADTITVEAVCSVTRASFGTTINGQWRTTDCDNGTNLVNAYGFAAGAQSSYNATVSGVPGQALQLKTPIGGIIQDVLPSYLYSNTSNPYSVAYLVPTGAYESWALAPGLAQGINSYTINNNGTSNGVDNYLPAVGCAEVGNRPFFTTLGIDAFNYHRTSNTCNVGGFATYQDRYLVQLTAGDEIEAVAIQSTGQGPVVISVRIRDARTAAGPIVVVGEPAAPSGANAAVIVADYTVPVGGTGVYEIIVGSTTPEIEYDFILGTP